MRAIVCREYGTPEDLVLDELPDPTAGPGQVVVRVRAAAVNYPDVLLIAGKYQIKVPRRSRRAARWPVTCWRWATGGPAARRPGVGDVAFVGGFAEQILVDARGLTPIPDGVDYADAAAFGVTNRTAYYTLRTVAPVKPGDWVVVLGAAGGVGLAAVDIAVLMGARVIAAASGADKLEVCRQRGAAECIDYDREDLEGPPQGDHRGGRRPGRARPGRRPLRRAGPARPGPRGRFVTLGYASGEIPKIPLNLVMLRGITLVGMEIRTFATDYPDADRAGRRRASAAVRRGQAAALHRRPLPLEQAPAALRYVADRKAVGKVVIDVA